MSGHSKWSTIKRQKGATDAKRGQAFTKLSNAITLAVKQGGGVSDSESNFKLRLAIDRARAANMPKDNIDRAIQRASGAGAGEVVELLYGGFGPGGIALLIEVVTDNKQRTVSFLKNVFDKNGGVLGSSGSVAYLFERRGEIVATKNNLSSEELLDKGIEAGVSDMEEEVGQVFYYVDPQLLANAKKSLEEQGIVIESTQLLYMPISFVQTLPVIQEKVVVLIERLEDLDDVQSVHSNMEFMQ